MAKLSHQNELLRTRYKHLNFRDLLQIYLIFLVFGIYFRPIIGYKGVLYHK